MFSELMSIALLSGSISATIFLSFKKWGLIEMYQIYRRKWMPPDVCDFCFCYWSSWLILLLISFFSISNIFYLAIPFAAASIGKVIINLAR